MFFKREKQEVITDPIPTDQTASSRTSENYDGLKDEKEQQQQQKQQQASDVPAKAAGPEVDYPVGVKLFLIMFSLLVSMFLVAVVSIYS